MSYARWLEGDVYVYRDATKNNLLTCLMCPLLKGDTYETPDAAQMLAHLEEHRATGGSVPEHAFERLKQEIEEGR